MYTISREDPTAPENSLTAATPSYAAPLMPLRERDKQVLIELFMQEGIEAIEEDIAYNLLIRCPEPCWEDDSFEFLRDYL
ncbi:hypothetical protein IFO70_00110 [Phormidium tenue FACHB-886]|nr:hypothetical protein [Phormidium tenue FACHB-886]